MLLLLPMTINVIYEEQDFLVINKPSGLAVHKTGLNDTKITLVDLMLEKYPEIKGVGENFFRPGIVHRLDKETSGLLIIAKTQSPFEYFKKLFQERKIKKTYIALVYGVLKNKSGRIEAPLGKLGNRQTTRIHGKKELQEKKAVTDYKVLKEYRSADFIYSLLEVSPITGRTHQIRVHLKTIGHPVVCDPIYGGKKAECPPALGRLFLHACRLSFVTPSGKSLALEADLPPELEAFLETLPKKED